MLIIDTQDEEEESKSVQEGSLDVSQTESATVSTYCKACLHADPSLLLLGEDGSVGWCYHLQELKETSGGEELDANGDEEVEPAPSTAPVVPVNHQVMMEVSERPPTQLLDGGSEDMDLVGYSI